MSRIILIVTISAFLHACTKPLGKECPLDQICNSAVLSVVNNTNDTIYYAFGSSQYTDTLVPGETDKIKGSNVRVTYETRKCEKKLQSWSTWTLMSSVGIWAFQLDHCEKKMVFGYDPQSQYHRIDLYDESE